MCEIFFCSYAEELNEVGTCESAFGFESSLESNWALRFEWNLRIESFQLQ